jgi:hypothetical protein
MLSDSSSTIKRRSLTKHARSRSGRPSDLGIDSVAACGEPAIDTKVSSKRSSNGFESVGLV